MRSPLSVRVVILTGSIVSLVTIAPAAVQNCQLENMIQQIYTRNILAASWKHANTLVNAMES